MFTNFLSTRVLSRSVTREATYIYTSLLLIITLRFTYGERKICSAIKNSQNIKNMIVAKPDSALYTALVICEQSVSKISAYE